MSLLEVNNVKKSYNDGTMALKGIDFKVEEGEFIVVIGPSGAGKSTLLRCVNRLVEASEGNIIFKGEDITSANRRKLKKIRREIGMIFQSFHLIERSSVLNNVLHGRLGYMSDLRGMFYLFSSEEKKAAYTLLDRVGLKDQVYKRADELSGGQQQRVGIARALAQNPSLMLADEPIASLDPISSEMIMNYLYTICREEKITCLCNLHQVDVAKKYATRIIGINSGKKVFEGTPDELTDEEIDRIYNQTKKESA
ncbi:phosphonate ABC transporter ATP-binding protein [Gracilibacillus sp. D59]|uniref:phosphonate ABC transporter ATP-binding protein n=1 Tax=Gracilibacillus sp. D59 TaxID=3457434 RepID=UPI003FCE4207